MVDLAPVPGAHPRGADLHGSWTRGTPPLHLQLAEVDTDSPRAVRETSTLTALLAPDGHDDLLTAELERTTPAHGAPAVGRPGTGPARGRQALLAGRHAGCGRLSASCVRGRQAVLWSRTRTSRSRCRHRRPSSTFAHLVLAMVPPRGHRASDGAKLTAALDGRGRIQRVVSVGGVPQGRLLAAAPWPSASATRRWMDGRCRRPYRRCSWKSPAEWGAVTVVAPILRRGPAPARRGYRTGARGRTSPRWTGRPSLTSSRTTRSVGVRGRRGDGGRSPLLPCWWPSRTGAVRDGATRWQPHRGRRARRGSGRTRDECMPRCRSSGCAPTSPMTLRLRRRVGRHHGRAATLDYPAGRRPAGADRRCEPRPAESFGFRPCPAGVAQLWKDGAITLVDRAGIDGPEARRPPGADAGHRALPGQDLGDVPAGFQGAIFRWDVDLATGRWSRPRRLSGHSRGRARRGGGARRPPGRHGVGGPRSSSVGHGCRGRHGRSSIRRLVHSGSSGVRHLRGISRRYPLPPPPLPRSPSTPLLNRDPGTAAHDPPPVILRGGGPPSLSFSPS